MPTAVSARSPTAKPYQGMLRPLKNFFGSRENVGFEALPRSAQGPKRPLPGRESRRSEPLGAQRLTVVDVEDLLQAWSNYQYSGALVREEAPVIGECIVDLLSDRWVDINAKTIAIQIVRYVKRKDAVGVSVGAFQLGRRRLPRVSSAKSVGERLRRQVLQIANSLILNGCCGGDWQGICDDTCLIASRTEAPGVPLRISNPSHTQPRGNEAESVPFPRKTSNKVCAGTQHRNGADADGQPSRGRLERV